MPVEIRREGERKVGNSGKKVDQGGDPEHSGSHGLGKAFRGHRGRRAVVGCRSVVELVMGRWVILAVYLHFLSELWL